MPAAVDIVINNGAGTPVAKTFTLQSPAAGYNSVADWALKEGTIGAVFPRISCLAKVTGNKSKQSQWKLRVPSSYTDTVTGLTRVGSAFEVNITTSVPDDFPEALKADAVAFLSNLAAHALFKAEVRDATPTT